MPRRGNFNSLGQRPRNRGKFNSLGQCFGGCCQGRANRKEFWGLVLLALLLEVGIWFVGERFGGLYGGILGCMGVGIFFFPVLWSVQIRRLHDVGLSGWWSLAHLLPGVGSLGLLFALLWRGTAGENRFDGEVPRRPSRLLWGVAGILWVFWFLQVPTPWGKVSEETHFITQPRKSDGEVDYYAAFMATYQDAYDHPEENGFRMICEALGKRAYSGFSSYASEIAPEDWQKVCEVLRLDPNLTPRFADFEPFDEAYLRKQLPTRKIQEEDGVEWENPDVSSLKIDPKEFARCCQYLSEEEKESDHYIEMVLGFYVDSHIRPWRGEDSPLAAAWLAKHGAFLDTVAEAMKLPHYAPYWIPYNTPLLSMNLDALMMYRHLAQLFSYRAAHALAENEPEKAIQDVLTMYRLGIHAGRGPGWVGGLIGIALEGMAHETLRQVLLFGNLTAEQLQSLENEMDSLPPRRTFAEMMESENWITFDAVQEILRKPRCIALLDEGLLNVGMNPVQQLCYIADSNIARQKFCEIWLPLYRKTIAFTNAYERDCFLREWKLPEPPALRVFGEDGLRLLYSLTIRGRSNIAAYEMLNLLTEHLSTVSSASLRGDARYRMARIALALERYRLENGRYPENRDEATPFLAKHGLDWYDPFTGKETLVYRLNPQSQEEWQREYDQKCQHLLEGKELPEEELYFSAEPFLFWKPYLLYSFGANREDDGGIPYGEDEVF
ncbi:MAG: DUF805 domain-containing protein [Planctomycetia bacterium]|nr:DUF805 domain-containing protein [Planctomycetia bacterium]